MSVLSSTAILLAFISLTIMIMPLPVGIEPWTTIGLFLLLIAPLLMWVAFFPKLEEAKLESDVFPMVAMVYLGGVTYMLKLRSANAPQFATAVYFTIGSLVAATSLCAAILLRRRK